MSFTIASSFCSPSYLDNHPVIGDETTNVKYWYAEVAIDSVFSSKYYASLRAKTTAREQFDIVVEHCVKSTWGLPLEDCSFSIQAKIKYTTFFESGSLEKIRESISSELIKSIKVDIASPQKATIRINIYKMYILWPLVSAAHLLASVANTIDCHPRLIWIIKDVTAGIDRLFARFSDALSTFRSDWERYRVEDSTPSVRFSSNSKKTQTVCVPCKKGQWIEFLDQWKSDLERTIWMEGDDYSECIFFQIYNEKQRSHGQTLMAYFNLYPTS